VSLDRWRMLSTIITSKGGGAQRLNLFSCQAAVGGPEAGLLMNLGHGTVAKNGAHRFKRANSRGGRMGLSLANGDRRGDMEERGGSAIYGTTMRGETTPFDAKGRGFL